MSASQHSRSLITQTGELQQATINRLFATLKLAYPNFSNGQEGEDLAATKRMWFAHLAEYRDDAIEKCAKAMIDKYPGRAPTLGQFKKMLDEIDGYRPTEPVDNYPKLCRICRAYEFTQYHHDICVTGEKRLPVVTDEQIAEVRVMFKNLR